MMSLGYIFQLSTGRKNYNLFVCPDKKTGNSLLEKHLKESDKKSGIKIKNAFIKDDISVCMNIVKVPKKEVRFFYDLMNKVYNDLLIMGHKESIDTITQFFDTLRCAGLEEERRCQGCENCDCER